MEQSTNSDEQFVGLETIAQGSAIELFNRELDKVLENILDPNTKAEAVRSVSLKIDIHPTENRGMGNVSVSASSKLAPPKSASTVLYFGKKAGHAVATERDPKQMAFDDLTPKPASVSSIEERK